MANKPTRRIPEPIVNPADRHEVWLHTDGSTEKGNVSLSPPKTVRLRSRQHIRLEDAGPLFKTKQDAADAIDLALEQFYKNHPTQTTTNYGENTTTEQAGSQ